MVTSVVATAPWGQAGAPSPWLWDPAESLQPCLLWESGRTAETKQCWGSISYRYKTGTVLLLFPGQSGYLLNLLSLTLQRKYRLGIFTQFCIVAYCCFPDCHIRTLIRSLHSPVQTREPQLLIRKAPAVLSNSMFANRSEGTCWERNRVGGRGMGQIKHTSIYNSQIYIQN